MTDQTTPLAVTSTAQSATNTIGAVLKEELLAALRPSLDQFFTNVESNPTVINVGAQAQAVLPNMIAAVPAAEGAGIKSVFVALQAAVDHALTVTVPAAQAAQTGAAAATAAPAVPAGNETTAG